MAEQYQRNYERIAARFQQRLAESVARYEADIIVLQDQHQDELESLQARIAELEGANEVASEAPAKGK
jgi:hypothetical protein